MLNPPTGVTLADYIAASKAGNESHIRITFLEQNIVLEDGDIEQSGININDLLNGDTNLTIGKAVSKEITVPILNSSKVDNLVWSSDFKLEYGLKISGTTKWITIGCFTGVRPDKLTNVEIIDFTALDYMQKFDVLADDWLDSLTYPMTVLQMFQSLCTFCGVGYAAGDELANIKARSFSEAPIVQKGLICRNILSAIAEACGCYARINADGNCQMVWFSDHTSDYTLTADEEFPPVIIGDNHVEPKKWSELESYTWEDLESMTWGELCGDSIIKIESVNVKHTEDDIGVYYPSQTTKNTYYIIDNPFLVTANQTEVTNYIAPLYTRLSSLIHYLPVSLSAIGCMLLEAGDIINITAYNQVLQMPVFCKATNWNGGLTDRIECTGEANNNEIPRNIRGKLSEGGRYHIFRNDLNELYSELYDGTTGDITLLHQQANRIEAYAEKKARVYYSATAPSGTQSDPLETGDLWIDTANANQLKRYNGSSWVDASFDDPDKYTVRSGISILSDGIEISGSKYIKMLSGSELDIESGGKIDVKSGGDIDVESGGDINVKNGANLNVKSGGDIEIENGGDINIASGGKIDVASGGDIDIESGGDVNIKSGGKLNIKNGGDIDIESGGDINVKNGGNLSIVTGGTFDVDTANFKISSANKYLKAGDWTLGNGGLSWKSGYEQFLIYKSTISNNTIIYFMFDITNTGDSAGFRFDADGDIVPFRNTASTYYLNPGLGSSSNKWGYGYFENLYGNLTGNVTGNCSGSAGSVAWSGVTGKPSDYPGGCTGTAGSVAWDNITGRPSLSSGHITDFNFTTSRPVSSYVTFDKSAPTGAPDNGWYNGFITSHNNYIASYIINKHRTSEWYVGYNEYNASTGTAPAPSWFKLLHSGNYASYAAKNTEAIKSITRSGTTFTATRCDGTTFTFTQQDNNTWRGYQTKSYSYAYSGLAAGDRLAVTGTNLGISTPSGYTPVAIKKVTTGNNDCVVVMTDAAATGGSTAVTIRNVASGSKSGTVGLDILYLQT